MLSPTAIHELKTFGIKRETTVIVCVKCMKADSEIPKDTKHPLADDYKKAQEKEIAALQDYGRRDRNRANVAKWRDRASRNPRVATATMIRVQIGNKMKQFSRCCGAARAVKTIDYYEYLYARWNDRCSMTLEQIGNQPSSVKDGIRFYGPDPTKGFSEDFILFQQQTGFQDKLNEELVRIFTDEDARKAQIQG